MVYILQILRKMVTQLLMLLLMTGVCFSQTEPNSEWQEYYKKGSGYAFKGEFEEAKIQFEKVLEIYPYYTPAKINLNIIKDAIEKKIKKETAINMVNGIHLALGLEGSFGKIASEAIDDFSKAIANDPNYAPAYFWRGSVYLNGSEGEKEKAISDFNKVIELEPNNALAFACRGGVYQEKCLLQKAQCDQAISDFKKAIEIEPEEPDLYNSIGILYAEVGRKEEAIEAYRNFIKYAKKNIPDREKVYAYQIKEIEQKIAELQKISSPAPK